MNLFHSGLHVCWNGSRQVERGGWTAKRKPVRMSWRHRGNHGLRLCLFLLHMVLTSVKEILTWKSCLSENFKRRCWVTACTVQQPWSGGVVHFWGTWDPMCFRPARHMRTFKSTNENWSVELMRFGMAIGSLHVSYTFIWYVCGENTMREWV